ncbi:MAG: hypothetical protein IKJ45_18055, partial [Kiritimatiellae bacterium]|nr:hypothetical protein [Kiritimatiellia bacterium]
MAYSDLLVQYFCWVWAKQINRPVAGRLSDGYRDLSRPHLCVNAAVLTDALDGEALAREGAADVGAPK